MRFVVVLSLSLFACSASTSAGPGIDGGGIDEDGAISPGDSSSTGDSKPSGSDTGIAADTGPSMPYCQQTCSTPSDCATASAAYDADNYACESGRCRWKGCNSDAECKSSFSSSAYVCKSQSGLMTCVKSCTTPTDCAIASAAYDADNWSCDASVCQYIGCLGDTECAALGAGYICRKVSTPGIDPSLVVPTCVKGCSKPADCATASVAYDTDNYACESGACRYIGCNSDSECQTAFMKSNYACK